MKKTALFLTAAIVLTFKPLSASAADVPQKAGYEYTIINNEATVTGFKGEPLYISLPETVEGCRIVEIRDNAFYECTSLRHIDIPPTVEKIGHHCFYGCSSLESVTIPDSVTEIGMGCFCGCTALVSAKVPDTVSELPESCFRCCTSLTDFSVPDEVLSIGDFCFSGCTSLKDIMIGSNTASLGDCSLYMCPELKYVYLPPSVKDIGVCAVGYAPTENGAVPCENITILGSKDSAARTYAKENDISFINADSAVPALMIKRASGQKVPVSVPSVFLICTFLSVIAFFTFTRRKRKHLLKTKINRILAK